MSLSSCQTPNIMQQRAILFLTSRRYRVYRHVFFLVVFLLLLLQASFLQDYSISQKLRSVAVIYPFLTLLFYVNVYVLVPRYLMKGHYPLYLVALCLVNAVVIYVLGLVLNIFVPEEALRHRQGNKEFIDGIFISVMLISTSTTLKLFQRWVIDMQRISSLKELSLKLELDLLKNQINPHFLFNMLNNLKSLVRKDPQLASEVIVSLSRFLRHQIYGTNDEKVPLKEEIAFLRNFLDLEKIRRDALDVRLESDLGDQKTSADMLPANLFTTFVENAIKHCASDGQEEPFIHLYFKAGTDLGRLEFRCENSWVGSGGPLEQARGVDGGLGLNNICRRLELLYGKDFTLAISSTNKSYVVSLNIPL